MVTSVAGGASSEWRKMKVPELREELASRGLENSGVKAVLIERLENDAPAVDDVRKDMDLNINERASLDHPKEKLLSSESIEIEAVVGEGDTNIKAPVATESLQFASQGAEGSAAHVVNGDAAAPSTDLEKKQRRAERFGLELMVSEVEKRRLRAARFGDTKTNGNAMTAPCEDMTKMSPTSKDAEAVKRKARAARFGIEEVRDKLSTPTENDDSAKKKARLARFGLDVKLDSLEQEKKKLRAARFGLGTGPKANVEPKAPLTVQQHPVT